MMKIYDYYDKVACVFSGNFGLFINDGSAIRTYKTMFNTGKLPPLVLSNPADYALYCLGSFDQESGEIVPEKNCLVHFIDLKEVNNDGE